MSVTLGTTKWARRIGVGTVIVIVLAAADDAQRGVTTLGRMLHDRLGPSVHLITGVYADIANFLRNTGIDPSDPWDRPTTISGIPLDQLALTAHTLIGGTGGI
ncbi:MAG: hypothetical protein EBT79_10405 [Actinobacteria bacterium]|nr:hypothetical protein [Actinomycetota bacterium]